VLAGSSRDRPGGAVALPARRGTAPTIRTGTDNRRSASVSRSLVALVAAEFPLVLLIKTTAQAPTCPPHTRRACGRGRPTRRGTAGTET
jgi:hypothetical protein